MAETKPDRKVQKALVRRFARVARGFWTGDQRRVAWLMTTALVVLIVLQLDRELPDQRLESRNLRRAGEEGRRRRRLPGVAFHSACHLQHRGRDHGGVGAHAHPAPLARLDDRARRRPLAQRWALLPAQSGRRRAQEPGAPPHRGHADRDRSAGRSRRRNSHRVSDLGDLHRRAVVRRRQPGGRLEWWQAQHPGLPGHFRGGVLHRHHIRHAVHRPQLRADG